MEKARTTARDPAASAPADRWARFRALLQLARAALVLTAVADAWLMVYLALGLEPVSGCNPALRQLGLPLSLLLTAVAVAGLHIYGIALNDLLDARRDRMFQPDRPVPAGQLALSTVLLTAVLSLLGALAAASFLGRGSTLLAMLAAAGILFFNVLGRWVPAVGILALGLIRALCMLVPNPQAGFFYPVWLTMSHVIACWALGHVMEGKRPRLRPSDVWILAGGWAFWTLAMAQWTATRRFDQTVPLAAWLLPVLAAAGFAVLAAAITGRGWGRPRARRAGGGAALRWGMLWLIIYDAAWLAGLGYLGPALLMAGLFAAALGSIALLQHHWHRPTPQAVYSLNPNADAPAARTGGTGRGPD